MSRTSRLAALLSVVLAAGMGSVAHGAPPESEVVEQPRVLVVIAGDAQRRAASLEVVEELIGRLDVEPVYEQRDTLDVAALVRAPSKQSEYLAQVYVEVSRDPLAVYVIDGGYERILIRRVPSGGTFGEIEREELATIAEGAVVALLDGGEIGVTRERAAAQLLPSAQAGSGSGATVTEETPSEVEPTGLPLPNADPTAPDTAAEGGRPIGPIERAPDRDRTRRIGVANPTTAGVRLEAGYGLSLWSVGAPPLNGPEIGIRVFAPEIRTAPGVRLVTQAWIPQSVPGSANDGGDLQLRVGGLGVRGMVTLAPVQRGRFDLLTAAGAGVDFVSSRVPNEVTTWTPIGMAGVEAGPAIRFGPGFDAAFVLGLWFDLVDTRFVSSVDERVIFDPFRVRFGAHLRLTWGSSPKER